MVSELFGQTPSLIRTELSELTESGVASIFEHLGLYGECLIEGYTNNVMNVRGNDVCCE